MEVTVIETGDLPTGTIISFEAGSIQRHAQVEKDKAIGLPASAGSEPVRVDLMARVGSHSFPVVPGQDVYDVPLGPAPGAPPGDGGEVKLKFQIRRAAGAEAGGGQGTEGRMGGAGGSDGSVDEGLEPDKNSSVGSPSRKLQTALTMRSYLDNHDVFRFMQVLLQDMVTYRPDDPTEYMIKRLEEHTQTYGYDEAM
jgi:hypothetical protein